MAEGEGTTEGVSATEIPTEPGRRQNGFLFSLRCRERYDSSMMSVATLKMDGKDFVVLPKREYERMLAKLEALAAQERGDVAEAKRRAKERSIPLDVLRKRLGR